MLKSPQSKGNLIKIKYNAEETKSGQRNCPKYKSPS